MQWNTILSTLKEKQARYIHVVSGTVPVYKATDRVLKLGEDRLMPAEVYGLVDEFIQNHQKKSLLRGEEILTVVPVDEKRLMRVHIFKQRGTLAFSGKVLQKKVPGLDEFHLNDDLKESLLEAKKGFYLVGGARDSGRTSILQALLHEYANTRSVHIISLEDCLEREFPDYQRSIISRRVYGEDLKDWNALKTTLFKGDVNILSMGEVHNLERMNLAMEMARRGVLVFGTVLGLDVQGCLARLMMCLDHSIEHREVMSEVLLGVYHRTRVTNFGGDSLHVDESFINAPNVKKHIRENHMQSIANFMKTSTRGDCWDYSKSYAGVVEAGGLAPSEVPEKYR